MRTAQCLCAVLCFCGVNSQIRQFQSHNSLHSVPDPQYNSALPMVAIEISPNTNCEAVDLRIFHNVEAPRAVLQVCLEREPGQPAWYDVTGWTTTNQPCHAVARRVDDSGEGLAVLVSGGDAGLRLRPSGATGPWQVEDSAQWGVPFLLMGNDRDTLIYREDA